jgi:epoxyqueuosine reductase
MDSTASDIEREITARAHALGFDGVGFAPALPPRRAELFHQWLAEGKAGTMTYLHRSAKRRADPRLVLENVRTIISVSQSYFTGRLPDAIRHNPSRGLIASYAWGQDYHDLLLAKLHRLAGHIEQLAPGHNSKCYVDTGHLLERELGERAGLGFVGKNTMLISPKMGSTFFLGEILTTLDLPQSALARMPSCGSCTRCMDVCPTHALPTAYVLDSTLCISYLTIEYRGVIPRDLRAQIGNHIFGCDDCQDCCPWNQRFSRESGEPAYRATVERQAPLLNELATLTAVQFGERFQGSAVLRAGYAGFLRNVAVALGNWRNSQALEGLEPLLRHSESLVRLHTVWSVGQMDSRVARQILSRIAAADEDAGVRAEAAAVLSDKKKP